MTKGPFMAPTMLDNLRVRWPVALAKLSAEEIASVYEAFYYSEYAGSNDEHFLAFAADCGYAIDWQNLTPEVLPKKEPFSEVTEHFEPEAISPGKPWDKYAAEVAAEIAVNPKPIRSVLQDWVMGLSFMQQSVLLSAMRNADGVAKRHPSKDIIRWYRRCIVLSAFDGRALTSPNEGGGGSYTGPVDDLTKAVDAFIDARDEMSLHYFAHAAHAFEIIGYKHPDVFIRTFWYDVYARMVHALHMWPETEAQMDSRLGDSAEGWQARNDPSSTCSD